MTMKPILFLLATAMVLPGTFSGSPALAQRRGEQQRVFDAARSGRLLPLPEIERRVLPTMGGAQYIGVELDLNSGIYTLKFLRNGSVIWVDVDGRTGQILARAGQ